ncbi:MAG: glycosyltransferase [Candidatus Levybacteria bacterium]|nr:glycosyltransferase [Candidatus Levybacteria bacterium]
MKKDIKICFFGTYDREYTANKIVLQGLLENNIPVLEVNSEIKLTRLDSQKDITWLALIKRILRKYKIFFEIFKNLDKFKKTDVIYVAFPGHFDVLFAWPLAKLFNKKLVLNPVVSFSYGFTQEQTILSKNSMRAKITKLGETGIYKLIDLLLPDTPFQKDFFKKTFNIPEEKIKVLPIGADDKYYKYTPYTNKSKKINVTYYGLYSPTHGVEHIIEAANILRNNKDIKFTFVGNGNTFQKNFDRAERLGLKSVEFFNNTPLDQHPAIIEKADLFLGFLQKHPLVDRVIPNKVYQGLALGKVVVTADAPVARSMFHHGEDMYLVKPSDGKALAKAILELKNKPEMRIRIAKNGYKLFLEKFTPKAIGKKLIKNIEEIL